jgi:hypothetical protein
VLNRDMVTSLTQLDLKVRGETQVRATAPDRVLAVGCSNLLKISDKVATHLNTGWANFVNLGQDRINDGQRSFRSKNFLKYS